jgi:hypothetical protein
MDALTLLSEHHPDLNALADDKQSPIIVAAANGNTKAVAWLRAHGANENYEWMGLRANDVSGELDQGRGSDMEEEAEGAGIYSTTTQRPLLSSEHDSIWDSCESTASESR